MEAVGKMSNNPPLVLEEGGLEWGQYSRQIEAL
jgi:hypothetical protein